MQRTLLTLTLCLMTFGAAGWAQAPAPAGKGASTQAAATKTAHTAHKASAAAAPSSKEIDINSASMGELKSISGIGDVYANKIMAGRPYKNKTQLKSRNILPAGVYEKVKDQLVAKQK